MNCSDAQCMWTTLCSLYQQESKESIYISELDILDKAFFTKTYRDLKQESKDSRDKQEEKRRKAQEYIKQLKKRTLCFNCGKNKHWRKECPEPLRNGMSDKTNTSEACAVTTDHGECSEESDPDIFSDNGSSSHAFIVMSKCSQALSVNMKRTIWYADTGATEHMSERRDWFSKFTLISASEWSVAVADDSSLWVLGIGDIDITRTVDGRQKKGVLKNVLYIPDELRWEPYMSLTFNR